MKKRNKLPLILPSLLTILGCIAIGSGSTYSLFTSEATNNITNSSGKVSLTSNIAISSLYSPTKIDSDGTISDATDASKDGKFANGGTVTLAGNNVTISEMAPGDKVTFSLSLKNESTIKVKYRVKLSGGSMLNKTLTDSETDEEKKLKLNYWNELEPSSNDDPIKSLTLSLELPTTYAKEFKDELVSIIVEAVQGNSEVTNPIEVPEASGDKTLEDNVTSAITDALKDSSSSSNDEIELELPKGEFTVPSNVSATSESGSSTETLKDKTVTMTGTIDTTVSVVHTSGTADDVINNSGATFIFDGLTIAGGNSDFTGMQCDKVIYKNCVITGKQTFYSSTVEFDNCTFEANGKYDYFFWTWGAKEVNITNCVFNTAGKAINLYGATATTLNITDTQFNSTDTQKRKSAVEIGRNEFDDNTKYVINFKNTSADNNFSNGQKGGDGSSVIISDLQTNLFSDRKYGINAKNTTSTFVVDVYINGSLYYESDATGTSLKK